MPTILEVCQGRLPLRTYPTGAVIIAEGTRVGRLFILADGAVEVSQRDYVLNTFTDPGAVFGEISVLLDSLHTATVRTTAPSRFYVVDDPSDFLRSAPELTLGLAQMLATRLHAMTTYLVDLKQQFEARSDPLGVLDEVLGTLERRVQALLADPRTNPLTANLCRREGDYWALGYGGTTVRLRNSRGVAYLAHLLWHPGRDFHVNELIYLVADGGTQRSPGDASLRVSHEIGDAGEVIDRDARAAYRRQVAALREDIAEAEQRNDAARATRLQAELDQLAHELRASARGRRVAAASERARIAVTKGIRSALARIRIGHPELARHLDATIKRGYRCSYVPDPRHPVEWSR